MQVRMFTGGLVGILYTIIKGHDQMYMKCSCIIGLYRYPISCFPYFLFKQYLILTKYHCTQFLHRRSPHLYLVGVILPWDWYQSYIISSSELPGIKNRCITHTLAQSPTRMHPRGTALYLKHKGIQNIIAHIKGLKYHGKVLGHYPILKPTAQYSILTTKVL